VLTTLMSLLDDPDPTQVDSTGEIPAGKDNLCAILYVANGCDDRLGGVPSDAPMPCQGDSSNIFLFHSGPWTAMVMGPRWARQGEPRGPRINAGEQRRARAA
jgi:hypothetical protein